MVHLWFTNFETTFGTLDKDRLQHSVDFTKILSFFGIIDL